MTWLFLAAGGVVVLALAGRKIEKTRESLSEPTGVPKASTSTAGKMSISGTGTSSKAVANLMGATAGPRTSIAPKTVLVPQITGANPVASVAVSNTSLTTKLGR